MKSTWNCASNVLCVRLDSLGDVLMTTPAFRALKESLSGRRLSLLSSGSGVEAAEFIPEIDEAIRFDAPWLKATDVRKDAQADHTAIQLLKDRKFDAAVIFTVATQSALPAALWCYLAEIPLRLAHCRENPYQLLTDWVPDQEANDGFRHEVQRQLELVASVGAHTTDTRLSFSVRDNDRNSICELLAAEKITSDTDWVVVHPGATAASRRYPVESYARLADMLIESGVKVVITGSAPEIDLVNQLRTAMVHSACSFAGRLDLGRMAALVEQAPLLITNNTGPVHLAAALGTPLVDLYALTNPQHQPWKVPHRVLFHDVSCKWCFKSVCPEVHHDCLRKVLPETVLDAATSLLHERRSAKKSIEGSTGESRTGTFSGQTRNHLVQAVDRRNVGGP